MKKDRCGLDSYLHLSFWLQSYGLSRLQFFVRMPQKMGGKPFAEKIYSAVISKGRDQDEADAQANEGQSAVRGAFQHGVMFAQELNKPSKHIQAENQAGHDRHGFQDQGQLIEPVQLLQMLVRERHGYLSCSVLLFRRFYADDDNAAQGKYADGSKLITLADTVHGIIDPFQISAAK